MVLALRYYVDCCHTPEVRQIAQSSHSASHSTLRSADEKQNYTEGNPTLVEVNENITIDFSGLLLSVLLHPVSILNNGATECEGAAANPANPRDWCLESVVIDTLGIHF